jgi:hypothetical protein
MRYSYQKNITVGRARLIHIETPLGIINIRPGLTDAKGRKVDSIEIIPDDYHISGRRVYLDGHRNSRLIEGRLLVGARRARTEGR